jgi:competence protein ComEC
MEIFAHKSGKCEERYAPIIFYFCLFALVLLCRLKLWEIAGPTLLIFLFLRLKSRGLKSAVCAALFAVLSFLWIHCRIGDVTPQLPVNRVLRGQLFIQKCTIREYKKGTRAYGFAKLVHCEQLGERIGQDIYFNLALRDKSVLPHRGQWVDGTFRLHDTQKSRQNFEKYLVGLGIRYKADNGTILAILSEGAVSQVINGLVERSFIAIGKGGSVSPPLRHVYRGMLLGDRSQMTAHEKSIYSRTGIAHLFAISGLHVGIIGWFLHSLTKGLFRIQFLALVLRAFVLCVFVEMVGGSPSAWRAFTMVFIFWIAPFLYRRSKGQASLFTAAFVALICNPMNILQTSFQLSYGVVFALMFYGVPLGQYLRRRIFAWRANYYEKSPMWATASRRMLARLAEMLALSVASTLPLIPLSIYHFQTFSVGGILLNPIVMPLASIPIVLGFVSLCFGLMHAFWLCHLLNFSAAVALRIIHGCASYINRWKWIESWPMQIGQMQALLWLTLICLCMHGHCARWRPGIRFCLPLLVAVFPLLFL